MVCNIWKIWLFLQTQRSSSGSNSAEHGWGHTSAVRVRGLARVSASENQMWPASQPASPSPHSLPHSLLLPIDLVWMAACQPMFPTIEKRVKITGTSCRKWNFNSSSPFIHWCERLPSRGEGSIVFRQRSRFSKRRINRKERGKNTPAFLWLL